MSDPENESEKQKGISKEAWTAIATIAVAVIGGIFTITNTILNKLSPSPSSSPSATPTEGSSSTSTRVPTSSSSTPLRVSNAILGKWSGVAKEPSGKSFRINLEIQRDCSLKEKCGYISVPDVPCYGEISLHQVSSNDYEFDVSNFDSRSNLKICTP